MLTPNSIGMFIVSLLFCNHLAGGTETETDCVRLNVFLLFSMFWVSSLQYRRLVCGLLSLYIVFPDHTDGETDIQTCE